MFLMHLETSSTSVQLIKHVTYTHVCSLAAGFRVCSIYAE